MNDLKLYVGLIRGDKRYNHVSLKVPTGGSLAVLDGVDTSGSARLLRLLEQTIVSFKDKSGNSFNPEVMDLHQLYVEDCWKIARESIRLIRNLESLIFPEYFYCQVCSSMGKANYTKVEEDWDALVEANLIDAFYLEDLPDLTYTTELKNGIVIPELRTAPGGTYKKIKRGPITLGAMIALQKDEWASKTEANMITASWDASIVEIPGMPPKTWNVYFRRRRDESFCKQFIVTNEDQEIMIKDSERQKIGMDFTHRSVKCSTCRSEIGGTADFTNFFSALLPMKSAR